MREDRPLAIQFSDLREFTALTAERGDAEAYRLVRSFVDLVEDRVSGRGGRVLKTYGDGVMTSFDDAMQAIECSIEMQDALCSEYCRDDGVSLSAGIGLAWGTAIRTGDDLFGSSVNLAKRIADVAKGGQIVVSSSVAENADLATSGRSYRDLGERSLKGLGEHRLYEVVWRDEIATLSTVRDDVELVLTDDDKLIIHSAKRAMEEIRGIQDRLAVLGDGEPGLRGRIRRAIGKRIARKLPDVVAWAVARAGMGTEHDLVDVEAQFEGRRLLLLVGGRERVALGGRTVDRREARRFVELLEERKRETGSRS